MSLYTEKLELDAQYSAAGRPAALARGSTCRPAACSWPCSWSTSSPGSGTDGARSHLGHAGPLACTTAPLRTKWRFLVPSRWSRPGALAPVLLGAPRSSAARQPVSPGAVISAHATFEASCEECHTPRAGRRRTCAASAATTPRARAGSPTRAHVLFGSGDPRKAAAARPTSTARAATSSTGAAARASRRSDQGQCARCHFRSLSAHPEFARAARERRRRARHPVPARPPRAGAREADGGRGEGHLPDAATSPPARAATSQPIAFDRHCASCHEKDGSVGTGRPHPAGGRGRSGAAHGRAAA